MRPASRDRRGWSIRNEGRDQVASAGVQCPPMSASPARVDSRGVAAGRSRTTDIRKNFGSSSDGQPDWRHLGHGRPPQFAGRAAGGGARTAGGGGGGLIAAAGGIAGRATGGGRITGGGGAGLAIAGGGGGGRVATGGGVGL